MFKSTDAGFSVVVKIIGESGLEYKSVKSHFVWLLCIFINYFDQLLSKIYVGIASRFILAIRKQTDTLNSIQNNGLFYVIYHLILKETKW